MQRNKRKSSAVRPVIFLALLSFLFVNISDVNSIFFVSDGKLEVITYFEGFPVGDLPDVESLEKSGFNLDYDLAEKFHQIKFDKKFDFQYALSASSTHLICGQPPKQNHTAAHRFVIPDNPRAILPPSRAPPRVLPS